MGTFEDEAKRELERGTPPTPAQKEHVDVMRQLFGRDAEMRKQEDPLKSFMQLLSQQ